MSARRSAVKKRISEGTARAYNIASSRGRIPRADLLTFIKLQTVVIGIRAMAINNANPFNQEQDKVISRRAITEKATYVVPAVLAVIAASQRPALAASHMASHKGGKGPKND